MKTESIEYQDGNMTLRGFVAFDDQTSHRRPGVLVMPEAFGLAPTPSNAPSGWRRWGTSRWRAIPMATASRSKICRRR